VRTASSREAAQPTSNPSAQRLHGYLPVPENRFQQVFQLARVQHSLTQDSRHNQPGCLLSMVKFFLLKKYVKFRYNMKYSIPNYKTF